MAFGYERQKRGLPDCLGHICPVKFNHVGGMNDNLSGGIVTNENEHLSLVSDG